ncbi:MAG TPA: response regulator, partial [Bacteroidia bacterium]|nr:response regulator [Bacteroidia bacterium]
GASSETKTVSDNAHLAKIRNAKILLVEDNEFNRIVAVDTLTEYFGEMQIDVARDGNEAIQKLEQSFYDLVLMDVQMPEMDGYDATKYIRDRMRAPLNKIPILAMTANATREEIEKCRECGMNGHIPKPFVPEMLFRKMSELLGEGSPVND